ncbi:MAG: LacI family DNA-binding transcriptional regulator [Flexilinea sp.]
MQRITIKDIAEETGVSVSTVSKALSRKGSVKKETRTKILSKAREMGYTINNVAQSLSRKEIKIGVIKPKLWPQFYGQIQKGIEAELDGLRDYKVSGVTMDTDPDITKGQMRDVFIDLVAQDVNAVIICVDITADYSLATAYLHNEGIPYVVVGNSWPQDDDNLGSVRVDSYKAGMLAGEFLRGIIEPDGYVAIFVADKKIPDHIDKVRGFTSEFDNTRSRVIGVYETFDESNAAYQITKEIIGKEPNLKGIYVSTVNSVSVCRCIRDFGKSEEIKLVVTDIFPELSEYIHSKIISAVIFQNTIMQGRLIVQQLYNTMISYKKKKADIFVTPQLVLRSNFDDYLANEQKDIRGKYIL